jgi:hypothetical protein
VRDALEGGFMNTIDILLAIDSEISRLQRAKELLSGTTSDTRRKRKPGRPAAPATASKATSFNPAELAAGPRKRRKLSAAGRARIAAAQRARWAKRKKESSS